MKKEIPIAKNKAVEFIFFGNYFYALCVLSLALESSLQQGFGLNSWPFYVLIAAATIVYYTYAYMGEINLRIVFFGRSIELLPTDTKTYYNQRVEWYRRNDRFLHSSQFVFLLIALSSALFLIFAKIKTQIFPPGFSEWLLLLSVPLMAFLYYGHAFHSVVNLRKAGWLKPFVIGFVWAGVVTIYPPLFYHWEHGLHYTFDMFAFWLLVKNWMYISVLAIMFDIKDYATDANKEIKTFVVRVGLRKTIFYILLPLIVVGLISFSLFAYYGDFSMQHYLINLIPFVFLLWVAYAMHKRRPILYYLMIIDGLMFFKGICGILGVILSKSF